jgi:hypothetical protein
MPQMREIIYDKMNNEEQKDDFRENLADWLPVVLIIGGLGLASFGIDKYALTMNIGFFVHGVLGLIDSIKRRYHRGISIRTLKVATQVMIAVLAIDNLIRPGSFYFLLLLVLLDKLILVPSRLESDTDGNTD